MSRQLLAEQRQKGRLCGNAFATRVMAENRRVRGAGHFLQVQK